MLFIFIFNFILGNVLELVYVYSMFELSGIKLFIFNNFALVLLNLVSISEKSAYKNVLCIPKLSHLSYFLFWDV